jgi:hypothetical protein
VKNAYLMAVSARNLRSFKVFDFVLCGLVSLTICVLAEN